MRTNIDLDDELIDEVMRKTGLPTKKAAVDAALRELLRTHRLRTALKELEGMGWEGDLDAMRLGLPDHRQP